MRYPDESISWPVERGLELRRQALKKFSCAVIETGLDDADAENHLREAIGLAASAYNWLEDSEYEESMHVEMHKYGRYAREHFDRRCFLQWDGRRYEQRCPIGVAHKRIGFSIGFIAKRFCSVCDEDLSECEHVPGQFYDVEASDLDGVCRICRRPSCLDHVGGQTYRGRASSIIREARITEISLVNKPKQPEARLLAIPIDTAALADFLGPEFRPGMRVNCDKCIMDCPGVERPLEEGGHL